MLSSPAEAAATLLAGAALFISATDAQVYKIDTPDAIKQSARSLAYDLMLLYEGNKTGQVPGILPGPPTENKGDYYWWQGGALMGTYIDYWHYTGDTSYNDVVTQGMLHQTGDYHDYQPLNYTASLGNDDQGFWGMSAMLAAENKFPNPPDDKPQWLALAQAVFNTQADPERHDSTCDGGIRWQIPPTNAGYDYKNTIANACFFNLGARLARYTLNETYSDWATKTFQWIWDRNYIDHKNYKVYDGGHVQNDCKDINKVQYSYNAALLIQGSAFMYNYTNGSDIWRERVEKLTEGILRDFFPKGIAYEFPCESHRGCTADMLSFKGYVHRWLAVTAQVAPFLKDKIMPVLRSSAKAAVAQCTGGANGRLCGFYWASGQYVDPATDKTSGAGERMDVLAAVSSLLVDEAEPPATNLTGISRGDPNSGSGGGRGRGGFTKTITTGDRAGASILTLLVLAGVISMWGWMSLD